MSFLERGLYWSTFAYFVFVCLAGVSSLSLAYFVARVSSTKRAELMRLQLTSAETVAHAHTEAAQALQERQKLEADVAHSQMQREQLHHRNLELQLELERERTARLGLEQRLTTRRIEPTERQAIASALSAFRGQKVSLILYPGDPEIAAFAGEIKTALEEAGMRVAMAPALLFGKPQPGIALEVGANRHGLATALAQALVAAGVCAGPISAVESDDADFLEITVGPRP